MTPAAMDALRAVVAEMRAAAKRTYGLSQLTAWADRLDALATPPTSDALTKAVEAAPLMLRQFARWLRDESVPVSECYKPDEIEAAAASIAAVRALGVRGEAWVSVDERLPPVQQMILMHCAGGSHAGPVIYGFYGMTSEDHRADFQLAHSGGRYYPVREAGSPVTHWQPLPAPPAALKEQAP